MIKQSIQIQNKLGLHARAAAKLVAAASTFESHIEMIYRNQSADCKSIMSLILLGATQHAEVELCIQGADELDAVQVITALINDKFGEGN